MSEPLTEAVIAEIESAMEALPRAYTDRIIAILRAEQEARAKAEAQRDRLVACLRGMIGAADYDDPAPGWQSRYAEGVAEEVADRACAALHEIEGGENV